MSMTVMTFNLRYPEIKDGPDYWPKRIGRAAAAILDHKPLVVGTQEGYHTMLTELEPFLERYAWIGDGRFGGRENEHNAIFYDREKLELQEHGQFWLSETPDVAASRSWDSMFPRICTWARFSLRDGGEGDRGTAFYVYNTHLDHHSQAARDNGVLVIAARMRAQRLEDGCPAILLGDFNSAPADLPIGMLRGEVAMGKERFELADAYSILNGNPGLTAHSFRGGEDGQPIDYIFASPEFSIRSVRVDRELRGGGYPSDHYPVVAELALA